jgi:hypothetical protein
VADFFHQVGFTGNIAASGGNAAAGVLDKAARDNVRASGERLPDLGELAIAVIHKDHHIGVGLAGGIGHFLDGIQVKGVALGITAAALDMHHGSGLGVLCNGGIVRRKVRQQGHLIVMDAVFLQRAAALASLANTDHAFQRIIGAAGGGQQGVPCAQQTEQRHCQGVGTTHELRAYQSVLGPHAARKYFLQLIAAIVPHAVTGGAKEMPGFHAAVRKGAQHFQLVIIADLFQVGKLIAAKFQRFAVQFQHLGFQIIELFNHSVSCLFYLL